MVACICRDILVIAAVSALSFVSLEIACNETFYRIPANSFGFSVGLLATALLSLYFLGQRHGGGSVEKVGVAPDPKRVGPASCNLEYG